MTGPGLDPRSASAQFLAALQRDRRALSKRAGVPVPRDPKGRFEKGCSGNPRGRPRDRILPAREALHQYGLEHLARLAALAGDPTLTPCERAVVHAELARLLFSFRAVRADARAEKKLRQQQRDDEVRALLLAALHRAAVANEPLPAVDPDWLR
jgi:hypothetical protein